MARRIAAFILTVSVYPAGCAAPPANRGGFDSDNPAARLYAIHQAGERGDRRAVPRLVEELSSDDPAVRMMAIQALQRITGTRRGYNPYAPLMDRRIAEDAWAESVRRGEWATGRGPEMRSGGDPATRAAADAP